VSVPIDATLYIALIPHSSVETSVENLLVGRCHPRVSSLIGDTLGKTPSSSYIANITLAPAFRSIFTTRFPTTWYIHLVTSPPPAAPPTASPVAGSQPRARTIAPRSSLSSAMDSPASLARKSASRR
jgi:hypothetical protein